MINLFRPGTAAACRTLLILEGVNGRLADNSEFFGLFAAG